MPADKENKAKDTKIKTEETAEKKIGKPETRVKKKSKFRMIAVLIFIAIFAIGTFISLRGSYLETLEIGENFTSVFWKDVIYKYAIMFVNFLILFIAFYVTNRSIKKGLKSFFEVEKKEMPKLPNKSIALVISVIGSLVLSNILTKTIVLAINSAFFGIDDPIFGMDIGYYVFQKPMIELAIFYFLGIVLATTIYSVAYYIIAFNVYFDGVDRKTLKQSKLIKQLTRSIMLIAIGIAALVFVKTQDIVLQGMLKLNDKDLTQIYGAGLTSATIKLWGYRILAVVIVVSVYLAIRAFKNNNIKKVIISILTVPIYLVGMVIVMIAFQMLFVNSNELDKEKQYIAYNIENTKNAYGINIDEINLENGGNITYEDVANNQDVIQNIPVVSKDATLKTLEEEQKNLGYYSFPNTTLAMYQINGTKEIVYVSPREILSGDTRTYNDKTYEYTHGMGAVISSASKTDENGRIEYIQKSFDGSDNKMQITQPRIYFGTETNDSIVVNSKDKKEFDYPTKDAKVNAENNYNGQAGLNLGFFDRVALGIKTGNLKLAFADGMTEESKILTNRNVIERAKTIMPYLMYDENPYLVKNSEGKLIWVLDAYTISNNYPYSQHENILTTEGEKTQINYIRNSVKVLIDSYDGTIKFYITDRTDPIVMSYRNSYPELFEDIDSSIPQDIAKHLVYPEYLYNIQSDILTRYHNVKPDVLYRSDDVWEKVAHTSSKTLKGTGAEMQPYYTMVKTTDSDKATLGLVIPYTPYDKQNIISYLVGTYDENGNSKLTVYRFPQDSNMVGPMQLDKQIEENEQIASEIESLNVTGTKVTRNMIIVPIGDKLLYVEPIYQTMLNESNVPILKKIIVASGNKVAIGDDIQEALKKLVSQAAVDIEVENTDNIEDLINAIIKANNNLTTSNTTNDWEMIGKDMKKLQELITKLEEVKTEQEKENKKKGINNTVNENAVNELMNSDNGLTNTINVLQ